MGSLSFLFLIFFLSFSAFSLVYSSIFCTSSGSESFMQAASLLSRVWRMKFLDVAKTMSRVGTGWAKERTSACCSVDSWDTASCGMNVTP